MNNDNLKIKLAWQTAFEIRTCPDGETLHAPEADDNLNRHLAICHVCRDKRAMSKEERNAWKTMREKFAAIALKPGTGTDKQPGQVWTIKKVFCGWREDGRFIKAPTVLLLEQIEGTKGWRVAQTYHDRQLMGNGDVTLGEQYGFAEAWNCYSLKEDRFEKYLGTVKPEQLQQVISAAEAVFEPVTAGSMLSFFRNMEIETGAFVAVPAVMELTEEWEAAVAPVTVQEWLENSLGSFTAVFGKLKKKLYNLPPVADTVQDLLFGARDGGVVPAFSMASDDEEMQVNVVRKDADGGIVINTLIATLTNNGWQEGTYYVAGRLNEEFPTGAHLLAWLSDHGTIVGECISQMQENSPYFDIVFHNVAESATELRFILVTP